MTALFFSNSVSFLLTYYTLDAILKVDKEKEKKTMKTRKTFTNSTGVKIERLSRWIKVRTDYNITPRHSLWDYATDDMGNSVFCTNCDTDNVEVTYFIYDDRKYALDQFFRTSYPDVYKNGSEEVVLAGYDSTAVFNIGFYGISIETDECVEYVRVYREVKNSL